LSSESLSSTHGEQAALDRVEIPEKSKIV